MRSLAWRPRLGPAVHYWVRQGNGRFSFCQSWLLEMQNMIPTEPLHLLLLAPQSHTTARPPPPNTTANKSPCYEAASQNSPALIPTPPSSSPPPPPPTLVKGSLPLIQRPAPSLCERCASLQPAQPPPPPTLFCFSIRRVDET